MSSSTNKSTESDTTETPSQVAAWLGKAKRPQRSFSLHSRLDLLAEVDQLEHLADAGDLEAQQKLRALVDQINDSRLDLTLEALTEDEAKALQAQAKLDGLSEVEIGATVAVASIIEPTFTIAEFLELIPAIGDAQVLKLLQAISDLKTRVPDVPSS